MSSSMSVVSSFTSVLSLGPELFMLIHLQSILRALALIGHIPNKFIVKVLQTTINPYEMLIIPHKLVPKIHISSFDFEPIFNDELYEQSGHEFQTSIYSLVFTLILYLA